MDETNRTPRRIAAGRSQAGGSSQNGLWHLDPGGNHVDPAGRHGAGKGLLKPVPLGQAPAAHHGADQGWRNRRLIDLITVLAVLGLLLAGYRYFQPTDLPTQTSFIVPSQHVHW